MKRLALSLFSCLIVFTLLLGSFGTAKAAVGDDPVVTPVSGDMEFATEIVPIASLPGTTELPDQMLVPVGFPAGEAQYEGPGVKVTKFDAGKATACFTISGTQYGWGGKVGMWDGTKWVKLPTTISTTKDETATTTACATITGSGTFAFIRYVADPSLLPKCELDGSKWSISIWPTPTLHFYASVFLPLGTPVSYKVISMDPVGGLSGAMSGTGTVGNLGYPTDADFLDSTIVIEQDVTVTIEISTSGCSQYITIHLGPASS